MAQEHEALRARWERLKQQKKRAYGEAEDLKRQYESAYAEYLEISRQENEAMLAVGAANRAGRDPIGRSASPAAPQAPNRSRAPFGRPQPSLRRRYW